MAASLDDNTLRELLRNAEDAEELAQLATYLPNKIDVVLELLFG